MKNLTCVICNEKFAAEHHRSWPDYCETCAEWLRALGKGPRQKGDEKDYTKLGITIAYLIKHDELKENDFIHGLIKGIRKT